MASRTSQKPVKAARKAAARRVGAKPILLAGGNPQIAKAEGDAPVQAFAMPPGASKHKEVRYLDIHEDDPFDEARLTAWVGQASRLPGERMSFAANVGIRATLTPRAQRA